MHSSYNNQNNKYGFQENFNGSSISEESEDIIIVEPLDEQQLAINKSSAQQLTGLYSTNSAIRINQNSRIGSEIKATYNNKPIQPNSINQKRAVYDPNATAIRSQNNSQYPQTQTLQTAQSAQSTPNRQPIIPRITQTVVPPSVQKVNPQITQTQTPQQQISQPSKNDLSMLKDKYLDSDEEEEVIRPSIQPRQLYNQPEPPKQPIEKTLPTESRRTITEQKEPILSSKEKQNQLSNLKQSLVTMDALPTKISTQAYSGSDLLQIYDIQNGKVIINKDFNNLISRDQNQIVFVGMYGQKKSKKNALLGELSKLTGKNKFGQPGIQLYSKPTIIGSKSFYFVNCKTDNQLLIMLFLFSCSIVLYNTQQLDDQTKQHFIVLDTMQKLFQNEYHISQLLPQLIWIQRDILKSQSIEQLLQQQTKLFEQLFKLKDVANLAPQGTSEYQTTLTQIRDKIMLGALSKQINSYNLNGPLFFAYVNQMADLINAPKQLQLEQLWINICEDYTKFIYNESLKSYVLKIEQWFKDSEIVNEIKMYNYFRDLKDISIQQIFCQSFMQNKNKHYQTYKKKLLEILYQKEKQALQFCQYSSQIENESTLDKVMPNLSVKDIDTFSKSFNNMIDQLLHQKYQLNQCPAFTEALQKNYKKLIDDLFLKYQKQASGGQEQEFQFQQSKQQVINKEEEIKKKKDQITHQEKKKELLLKEIQGLQEQIKLERESVNNNPDGQNNNGGGQEQQVSEEAIYAAKQQKAKLEEEKRMVRKNYELQKTKSQESGCLIF